MATAAIGRTAARGRGRAALLTLLAGPVFAGAALFLSSEGHRAPVTHMAVTHADAPHSRTPAPWASASSLRVRPGGSFTVKAGGFAPGRKVIVSVVAPGSDDRALQALTDRYGDITAVVGVPAGAQSGWGRVNISGRSADGGPLTQEVAIQVLPPDQEARRRS